MATILAGAVALTAAALIARASLKALSRTSTSSLSSSTTLKWMPKNKQFLKGGFESKMSKREAALILGIRENAAKDKIKIAHRNLMVLNHPDRGGSPFVASKVNEAKDLLF